MISFDSIVFVSRFEHWRFSVVLEYGMSRSNFDSKYHPVVYLKLNIRMKNIIPFEWLNPDYAIQLNTSTTTKPAIITHFPSIDAINFYFINLISNHFNRSRLSCSAVSLTVRLLTVTKYCRIGIHCERPWLILMSNNEHISFLFIGTGVFIPCPLGLNARITCRASMQPTAIGAFFTIE